MSQSNAQQVQQPTQAHLSGNDNAERVISEQPVRSPRPCSDLHS
jgi:hypothetical protein